MILTHRERGVRHRLLDVCSLDEREVLLDLLQRPARTDQVLPNLALQQPWLRAARTCRHAIHSDATARLRRRRRSWPRTGPRWSTAPSRTPTRPPASRTCCPATTPSPTSATPAWTASPSSRSGPRVSPGAAPLASCPCRAPRLACQVGTRLAVAGTGRWPGSRSPLRRPTRVAHRADD
jgi:hypothetical protein